MIGIVTDSTSQLPPALSQRFGVEVVPLTVSVDGVEYLEGVDLSVEQFYGAWADGHVPAVSTSQPSPGQFLEVYQRLAAAGADEILSIHIAASMSGTLNSAALAAASVDVDVRLVDTRTASFGISCCVWAAAEAIAGGADLADAAEIAEVRAAQLGTAFIVGVPALTDRSGRAEGLDLESAAERGVPVISMSDGELAVLETVTTIEDAVDAMTTYALGWTPSSEDGLRLAIGTSDVSSGMASSLLTDALRGQPAVHEIVQYVIGPSVGAHTGPGTAGVFVF